MRINGKLVAAAPLNGNQVGPENSPKFDGSPRAVNTLLPPSSGWEKDSCLGAIFHISKLAAYISSPSIWWWTRHDFCFASSLFVFQFGALPFPFPFRPASSSSSSAHLICLLLFGFCGWAATLNNNSGEKFSAVAFILAYSMYVDEDAIKKLLYSTSTCAWHFPLGERVWVWVKCALLRLGKCRFSRTQSHPPPRPAIGHWQGPRPAGLHVGLTLAAGLVKATHSTSAGECKYKASIDTQSFIRIELHWDKEFRQRLCLFNTYLTFQIYKYNLKELLKI